MDNTGLVFVYLSLMPPHIRMRDRAILPASYCDNPCQTNGFRATSERLSIAAGTSVNNVLGDEYGKLCSCMRTDCCELHTTDIKIIESYGNHKNRITCSLPVV